MKKIISLIVVFCLVLSIFAVPVLGATVTIPVTIKSDAATKYFVSSGFGYNESNPSAEVVQPDSNWETDGGLENVPWIWADSNDLLKDSAYFDTFLMWREIVIPDNALNIKATLYCNSTNVYMALLNEGFGLGIIDDGYTDFVDEFNENPAQASCIGSIDTVDSVEDVILYPGVNFLLFMVAYVPNDYSDEIAYCLAYKMVITYEVPSTEIEVDIDIKPGSDTNAINVNGVGSIPMVIMGSEDFDVSQIDVGSITFEGMKVKVVGKAEKALAHIEDITGPGSDLINLVPDEYPDLIIHIADKDGSLLPGSTTATIRGTLLLEFGSIPFTGQDNIKITP